MTGKNCPFCGAEIEPGKARDKAVCPSCGREFDYNTLNAEARGRTRLDEFTRVRANSDIRKKPRCNGKGDANFASRRLFRLCFSAFGDKS